MRNIGLWLRRSVVWCLYGALLTPLIFQSDFMHPLVVVKTVFFQALIELAFAGYIALAVAYKEYRPRVTPLLIAVCVLFAAIVVSSVFGVNGMRSIWSVPERMTGIVLMAHLVAYFIMLSGMRGAFSWQRYLSASVVVSFFVALVPVVQLFFPHVFFDRMSDRVSGTIGNPIFLSAYLLFHVFIAAWLVREARVAGKIWWSYASAALFDFLIIVLTQTRGALLAIIASVAFLSVYALAGTGNRSVWRGIFAAWTLAVLFSGAFWMTRANPVWQGVPILSRVVNEGFRSDNRLIAWRAGLQVFAERPVIGIGWENFYTGFNAHYDPHLLRRGFSETFFDRPHNIFIQFLAETGIIGFSAYLFLLTCAFYYARRNAYCIALLLAYSVQNFFVFDSMSSYFMFFLVLAFIDRDSAGMRTSVVPCNAGNIRIAALFAVCGAFALYGIYFFNYRVYAANHFEWISVNYFVHGQMPEGIEYMDKALAASTPYHAYIAKDLYPNIALLYRQNLPLPNVRDLVARAVNGMKTAAEAEPLNYGFWIGFADMMPLIGALDLKYLDEGITILDHADSLSPHRQSTLYVRAKLLNLKGDKAGAQKAMADAIALDPQVGDAHFFYALLLLEGGDKEGGMRELARARELGREPKNVNEASVAAGNLGDLGAYRESALYFQKALLFEPDNAEMTIKLGLVYYFSGDKDAARRFIGGEVMKKQDLKKSPQYESLLPILRDLGMESR